MRSAAFVGGLAMAFCSLAIPAFAQQGAAANKPRNVMGKVTAKTDKSLDVQGRQRGGPVTTTVNVDDNTQYMKLAKGSAADVAVGCIVVVYGAKDGAKITSTGVLVLAPANGNPAAARPITMIAGRFLGAKRGVRPSFGKVTQADPLQIKSGKETLDVTTPDKVYTVSAIALTDIAVNDMVLVVPTAVADNNTVTAKTVFQAPAMQRPARGRRQKPAPAQ